MNNIVSHVETICDYSSNIICKYTVHFEVLVKYKHCIHCGKSVYKVQPFNSLSPHL